MSMFTFESAFPVAAASVTGSTRKGGRRRVSTAAASTVKEYAQMTTAEKRLFNLEKARAARAASVQAAPPASPPEKVEKAARGEYVRTNVKLTNYGHGRRETEIDGTRVGIAWDGTKSVFVYVIGRTVKVGGATRDLAVAKLNADLSERGLPPVRA